MSENIDQTSGVETGSATAVADVSDLAQTKQATRSDNARHKKVVNSIFKWIFGAIGEVTAVTLGLAFIWLCAVNMVIAQRVADISFLKADASRWFSGAFEGKSADVGKMTLAWEAANNTVIFRANDISVDTARGKTLNSLTFIETELALRDVVQGKLDPIRVVIDGGELSFMRDAKGNFIAGMGTPETVGQFGPVWRGQSNDGDNDLEIGRIKSLKIDNAKIYVRDAGANYSAQLEKTAFDVTFATNSILFDMAADLSVPESLDTSPLSLRGVVSPDLQNIDAVFEAVNLNPSKMLPNLNSLKPFLALDAALEGSLHAVANREMGLQKLDITLSAGAGTLNWNDTVNEFVSAELGGAYDPEAQALNVSKLMLNSDLVSAEGSAAISNLGTPAEGLFSKDTRFELKLDTARWNGVSLGIAPVAISNARVTGSVKRAENKVDFDQLTANFGTFSPQLKASLTRNAEGAPIAASVSGRINGTITDGQLLALWPKTLIVGARRWVDNAIDRAVLSNLNISFNADEAVLAGEPLKDPNLTLTFDLKDGQVKYISTMTPITGVVGKGRLLGNRVEFKLEKGHVDDVNIKSGTVTIPRIYPYGGNLNVQGNARGPIKTLVGLLDQKPFEYVTPYGVNPDDFSGTGDISLSVTRPLRESVSYEKIRYQISGQLTDVTAPFSIGKNKLTNGNVNVLANREGLSVKGPVKIGPWQADLAWQEVFDNGATPTRYRVNGRLSPSDLDSFGIGMREFMGGGDVILSIDAQADGLAISSAQLVADLSETDMRIGPYWTKPKGTDAKMTGVLAFSKDKQLSLQDFVIQSPGLDLAGALNIGADFKLKDLNFTRAKIAGFIDAAAQIKPGPNQERFDIYLTGDYLDVSPLVESAFGGGGAAGMDVPILLTSAIKRFVLSETYVVQDANLLFAHNGFGITEARLKGRTNDGPVTVNLSTDGKKSLRTLEIDVPDASDASFAFFDLQSLRGGRLQLSADLPAVGTSGPLTGTATVEDVRIVQAPIMTTMLSLASLQGLADALGGEGLKFNQLIVPFSYNEGRMSVREGRAAGPGLGMTANGEIDFANKVLDMDGVLVPAYTANSMLGSIPLIGDIFVGKKGEGIFALNYTVKGAFDGAQVAVNPLSALTPGFLRGIFATQRDDLPEQLREQIEAVRPATELREEP